METIGIHESPRCALDDLRFYQYFLLILFFLSFYILISCFSIKHTAIIELIEGEGSIVEMKEMNHNISNLSHVLWNTVNFQESYPVSTHYTFIYYLLNRKENILINLIKDNFTIERTNEWEIIERISLALKSCPN